MKPIKISKNRIKKSDDIKTDWEFESTGNTIYAWEGIFGINHNLEIYSGYDDCDVDSSLTKDEKIELADYMIDLWNKYKKSINHDNN